MTIGEKRVRFLLFALFGVIVAAFEPGPCGGVEDHMIDREITEANLTAHLETLTRTIGERSVARLWNLEKSAQYIEAFYRQIGIESTREPVSYGRETVYNVIADIGLPHGEAKVFLVGSHYDSLKGTVGADDNGSAVAVQLELARELARQEKEGKLNVTVRLVFFALEEPPAYATWAMGSRVYARKAKRNKERIDGMICLEMVGYTCHQPGCQHYPFPLMFLNYPKIGDFIGIVGNMRSRGFTRDLYQSFQENADLPVVKLTVPGSGYLLPTVRLSDHASFWDQGYKAVMITDTAFYRNPHYHKSSDTMEKLDFTFMAQLVRSLLLFFHSQNSS